MKKNFISIICAVFLSIGSAAFADPLPTITYEFSGIGIYNKDTPFGPFGTYGSFYGLGIVHYDREIENLDLYTTYDWTLDYSIDVEDIAGSEPFDFSKTRTGVELGTFALADPGDGNTLLNARSYIESLPNPGIFSGISYMQFGNWDEGTLLLGLSEPIAGLQSAIVSLDGEVQISANAVAPVPEPATMLLFGTGLAGLAGFSFRRKKN